MIKIVKGDLFKTDANIIAHQVNCMGVMGSGVAKTIKERFPEAFREYVELVDSHAMQNHPDIEEDFRKGLLGQVQGVRIGQGMWVANIFGQYKYGTDGKQYTKTDALFKGFKTVRSIAEKNELKVAMPYMIGCYRGGADWKEVEDLLLTAFDGYEVTLHKL